METGFEDVAIVSPLARLQPDNLGTRLFGIALQSGNQKIILSHNKASLVGPRPMNSSNHKVLWVRQAGFPNKKKNCYRNKITIAVVPISRNFAMYYLAASLANQKLFLPPYER